MLSLLDSELETGRASALAPSRGGVEPPETSDGGPRPESSDERFGSTRLVRLPVIRVGVPLEAGAAEEADPK